MEAKKFKVIIVEDVKLELKGTEEIFRHEIPDAEVIGTAILVIHAIIQFDRLIPVVDIGICVKAVISAASAGWS